MITQVKNIRETVEEMIATGNIYELNQRDGGLGKNWNFKFILTCKLS